MWTVTYLPVVREELDALPNDMRSKLLRFADIIETRGLEQLREPQVKHLEGRLWEIRLSGRDGIARAVYVTAFEKRVVIVRIFIKKTQKTPPRELKLARERAKEIK